MTLAILSLLLLLAVAGDVAQTVRLRESRRAEASLRTRLLDVGRRRVSISLRPDYTDTDLRDAAAMLTATADHRAGPVIR